MRKPLAVFVTIVSFALTAGAAETMTGAKLMKLVREKNNSKTQVSQVSMKLVDKKGRSQDRKLRIYAEQVGDVENTLTRFLEPTRVKGVGFLVVNDESGSHRYLYTPTQKKTRRVPEGDNKKSFQGTDFTYYDLSPHDVETDTYQPLETTTLDGHEVWVCTSQPGEDNPLYSKVVQYVRKDIYIPVKMEFYDLDGKLLKVSTVEDLKKIDGYWTPVRSVMHNVQIDHKTVMQIDQVAYDEKIPEKVFSKTYLERGA
jgi:hypothetical protein